MDDSKDVYLLIGKKNYCVRTALDDETLARVKLLINEAYGQPKRGVDQENLLTLTCLQLAYALDTVRGKLDALMEKLDKADGGQ